MSLLEHAARSPAEHAETRLRFFMEAGTTLDASLDLATTLETPAAIVVRRLGDVCLIDLVGPDDRVQRRVIRHRDPGTADRLRSPVRRRPSAFDPGGAVRETIRSRRTHFIPRVSPEIVERAVADPEQRALVLRLQYRSAVVVPLAAHGRILGAITACLVGADGLLYTELRRADQAQRHAPTARQPSRPPQDRAAVTMISVQVSSGRRVLSRTRW